MPKTKQQKQDIVGSVTDKLSKSKSVVFTNYQGLTMTQLSQLRGKLADNQAEFHVTKNNLLKIALNNNNLPSPDDKLVAGPIATLFAYEDEIAPIKTLTAFLKDSQIGEIKGGLLNGELLSGDRVNQLSELPSKDQLRGQVVGALGSPLYGIVGVLQANLRNLVYALEQIRKSKGGE